MVLQEPQAPAPKLSGAVLVGHLFGVTCDDFDLVSSEGREWSRWVLVTRDRLMAATEAIFLGRNHVMSVPVAAGQRSLLRKFFASLPPPRHL